MVELALNVATELVLLTINKVSGRSIPKNETTQKAGEAIVFSIGLGAAAIWVVAQANGMRAQSATYVFIGLGLAALLFAFIGVKRLRHGIKLPPDRIE